MSDGTHTECQETNSELELKRLRSERDHYRENVIPDLQAQLDQERQRREQAEGLLRKAKFEIGGDVECGPDPEITQGALADRIDKHFGEWNG